MREIPLTQGKVALVDDEDYEDLMHFKWHAYPSRGTYYAARNTPRGEGKRTTLQMHRQIIRAPRGQRVDHADGDGLHNWRGNLRFCSNAENTRNCHARKVDGSSRYRGVSWHKHKGKWQAYITVNYTRIFLGYFSVEEDAAKEYDRAARQYFGEFAAPNLVEG